MSRKELKNFAKKMAKLEHIIQTSSDDNAVRRAQDEILVLSSKVGDLEDITLIDEMVQDLLEKNKF